MKERLPSRPRKTQSFYKYVDSKLKTQVSRVGNLKTGGGNVISEDGDKASHTSNNFFSNVFTRHDTHSRPMPEIVDRCPDSLLSTTEVREAAVLDILNTETRQIAWAFTRVNDDDDDEQQLQCSMLMFGSSRRTKSRKERNYAPTLANSWLRHCVHGRSCTTQLLKVWT